MTPTRNWAPWRPGSTRSPHCSARATAASAPTPGSSPGSTRRPASRCWPTTRISHPSCRPSGTRWACTAGRSPSPAPTTSPGFTFSGLPGVVIGHNQDISWGMTNLGADVTDLYLEKFRDGGYLYDGKRRPYKTRQETIKVAGGQSREITVRETNNGPSSPTATSEAAQGRRRVPRGQRRPRPRRRLRGLAALDGSEPQQDHGRGLQAQPRRRLQGIPRRRPRLRGPLAEPDLRRHRGQHRLPGAGPHPRARRGRRTLPGARLGPALPLEELRAAEARCRGSTTPNAATS